MWLRSLSTAYPRGYILVARWAARLRDNIYAEAGSTAAGSTPTSNPRVSNDSHGFNKARRQGEPSANGARIGGNNNEADVRATAMTRSASVDLNLVRRESVDAGNRIESWPPMRCCLHANHDGPGLGQVVRVPPLLQDPRGGYRSGTSRRQRKAGP